ncbi:MAG: gliding motility-associated C-terminal domain-containing protein [Saprospiraceae bacterium]|nr:MAG: gliding motility protein SprB [Bacteroidetes bacterium OLB9]MCO6464918.1 gliding motility-associated C-terminal domain-containing protein [Saprospiraceae bacterium]
MLFRRSTLFTLLLLAIVQTGLFSQPLVEFIADMKQGMKGDRVCIDFKVNNFTDVESMQFNISYNGAIVTPECPIDLTSSALAGNIDQNNFNCKDKDNGFIKFVWENTPPLSLPDGSILFTVCFELVGNPGNISPVYVNSLLLDLEVCQVFDGETTCRNEVISQTGTITIISNTLQVFVGRCDADSGNIGAGGTATFYGAGGTPPYTYTITPGGYTGTLTDAGVRETVTGIPPGNYTIEITDSAGLKSSKTFNISDNIPITVQEVVKDPTCFSRRNGSISVDVSGGLPPYQYEWSNLVSGRDSINDLYAGLYQVTITDFNGCQKVQNFTLRADTLKFDVAIKDSTACETAKTGVITIQNVTGGTPHIGNQNHLYDYIINNTGRSKPFGTLINISGIGAGIVKVLVIDSLGCSAERLINMPFAKVVEIDTIELRDISCFGANDGLVRLRAKPDGAYSYVPSGNIPGGGTNQGGTFVAEGLGAGQYSVTARDQDGCMSSLNFEIHEPEALVINPAVVQPDCAVKGSILLTPSGGTGAYTYTWEGGYGNVNELTNLDGGTYNVTVSDANGCTVTSQFVLNDYGALNINITTINVSCVGRTDGSATVEVLSSTGTVPMFTIFWRDSAGNEIPVKTTTISNLAAGSYTVEVVTIDGCKSGERSFIILDGEDFTINTQITNALCYGEDGKVEAAANGQTTGYSFQWIDKSTGVTVGNNHILVAGAGTYVLSITNGNGCVKETEVTITQPDELIVPQPEVRNVTCFGKSDGQAAILNGPAGQDYQWSNGSKGLFAIDLPQGEAWVVATKGNCVSDTLFFTISSFPKIEVDASKTVIVNPTCYGDTNGSIKVEATGGSGIGYQYQWSNNTVGNTITNLGVGQYIVEISDDKNCIQRDTFTLTQPDKLEAYLDKVKSVELDCNNQDRGRIALLTTGGNPGVKTVTWDLGIETEGPVAVNLGPGTYCASISDNLGCLDTFCYTLIAPVPLSGKIRTPEEPLCFGGTTCISVDYLTGGTGNKYTFQINNGTRYPIDSCVTVFAGQYFINLIDSAGCTIDTIITIGQPDQIVVELGDDKESQLGLPSPVITPFINAPVGIGHLDWSPNENITCLTDDCSSIEVAPSFTTTYTLTVTDLNGCTGVDEITVKVRDVRNVYFANAFSPNGDGFNDYFQAVTGPGVDRILTFAIYDRWGNMVFLKENYVPDPAGSDGWDGSFNGRKLDPGVFVYYAKARFIDNKEIDYSGSVTLMDKVKN